MRDAETLFKGVLDNSISLTDLNNEELDQVLDDLVEMAEALLESEHHEAGIAMLAALDQAIDLRNQFPDVGFEDAILAAEARGSVYWEFDEYTVH